MKYLVIDGNSIINRAFYGIKLLNAKDGHFTNAIYGFMNILLHLNEKYIPDSIIVAFDVHQPTFRHKMYSEYKAGRKGAPPELIEQFEPLKKLLKAYGCSIIECPGYEADDIIGTVSVSINDDDHCYIATGDRDSLQLISDNVSVLLTTTKMGKTQTVEYTKELLKEEYGVSPSGMIEIKALQGDNSDNIPGVSGIGPKTAGDLIKKYNNIDNIYSQIDTIEVTPGVRTKLISGKENAYFSRELGTICTQAPINTNMTDYLNIQYDNNALLKELAYHEMFKMIDKLHLNTGINNNLSDECVSENNNAVNIQLADISDAKSMLSEKTQIVVSIIEEDSTPVYAVFADNRDIVVVENNTLGFISFINDIFSSGHEFITEDCKSLYSAALKNGLKITNIIFDIKLAAYLLDVNSNDYSVPSLALAYNVNNVPVEFIGSDIVSLYDKYADVFNSASLSYRLYKRLESIIVEREQESLLKDIEIPLAEVLAATEINGMKVDVKGIEDFSQLLTTRIADIENSIYEIAGEKFNINSPKQLGTILFEKLGLPAKKKTKTGYSTNADVLESLAEDYPIVSMVLEYRAHTKLKSTYCEGLLKAVDSDNRVRSTFNQTETRTGRLSSTEPNLQNIPVRTPLGREMRKFFIAEDGYSIIDADYSQIELRVLAALSDDKNMTDAFNSDTDIHSVTASKVFNIPIDTVTSELRSKAKAVNFGIVYGIGAFSLAKDIRSTRAEADAFIKSYLALYSSVDKYMNECIEFAKASGYSETYFRRRRYLPELSSSNGMIRSFGERVARNMPIQGTAADIIKIAMIKVFNRLKSEYPDTKLIMQVHDELMAEAPEKDAEAVAEIIKQEMENAVKLSVCLKADTAIGKSWYDAKE